MKRKHTKETKEKIGNALRGRKHNYPTKRKIDTSLLGRRFGRLLVLSFNSMRKRASYWNCICDCGKEKVARRNLLVRGDTQSCGCLYKERIKIWNLKHGGYKDGRRDIKCLLWSNAKHRASCKNLQFSIVLQDIVIPEKCPLLGIPLLKGTGGRIIPNSPSIDRIDPTGGYTKDNIWVISHKANTIKSNLSLLELQCILKKLEKILEKHNES